MASSRVLFVTGKLAEPALRRTLADLASRTEFDYAVAVLPISVVALATVSWIVRHLIVPPGIDRIVLPGLCSGELESLREKAGVLVERGPQDLRDLPAWFGEANEPLKDYGAYDIEIIAEINHAPSCSAESLLAQARAFQAAGADVIDLGCTPGETWSSVADAVKMLRTAGMRVSIDSFNAAEVEAAVTGGAELVLSVNSSNVQTAKHLHERFGTCEFVVVPDVPAQLNSLYGTVELLQKWGAPFRLDPVLEPIGFGFAASLGRYLEVRRRYPDVEMMMGVGNLTELTDVDSAGINVLLLGFCQELGIRSVLTTEVINWCRSCVKELHLARKLVGYAYKNRVLPKHLEEDLILLRDPRLLEHGAHVLKEMAERIKDRNFRLFAERGKIQVLNNQMALEGADPFELFAEMAKRGDIDPSHAFYLGYEMAKAFTALSLGKNYVQDQALRWGFLRVPEISHRGILEEELKESGESSVEGT